MAWPPKKNQALTVPGFIRDADGDLIADPAGLTGRISKDFAADVATTNTPAVVVAGSRMLKLALTAAEMNADNVMWTITSTTTGAKEFAGSLYTTKNPLDLFSQIVECVVDAGASATSIPTSSQDPAASVTDQWKGRIVIFRRDTTTAALRGQATDITANTSGGTLTVTALTTVPVSGDTFIIV